MITIEQKLKVFTKIVIESLNKEYEQLIHDLDKKDEDALNDYKDDLVKRATLHKKELIEKGELEKKRMISKLKVDNRKEIMRKRADFVQDIILKLMKRLEEYIGQPEYEAYLMNQLIHIPDNLLDDDLIVEMTEKDQRQFGEKFKATIKEKQGNNVNIVYETLDEEAIGGFIVFTNDRRFKLDCTLKSMIEEKTDLIGRRVNELLNRAGDKDE